MALAHDTTGLHLRLHRGMQADSRHVHVHAHGCEFGRLVFEVSVAAAPPVKLQ